MKAATVQSDVLLLITAAIWGFAFVAQRLGVDAGLIQKDAPSSGPVVSQVVFSLEQHLPKQKDWTLVLGSEVTQTVNETFDLLDPDERYDVATNDYMDVCELVVSPAANAVRAVVQITVDNANPERPGGLVFTGRCTSFPNPCK